MLAIQILVAILALAWIATAALRGVKRNQSGEVAGFDVTRVMLPVFVFAALVLAVFPSMGQVPAGSRGVVLQFGAVTGEVKPEGLYFVTPFVQSVRLMNVQIHAHKAPATAASRDMQNVATEITLNYRLDPAAVATTYRDLGMDYESRIITPTVQEAVKAATAQYDAEKLITERTSVRSTIETVLRERLANHHIILDQISITNFEFSREFAHAIEQKQVALQLALKAENEVREAKFRADAAVATARGAAEAIRIQTEAIQRQGGESYVNLKAIEKWNGVLPQWMAGGGQVPFVSVPAPR